MSNRSGRQKVPAPADGSGHGITPRSGGTTRAAPACPGELHRRICKRFARLRVGYVRARFSGGESVSPGIYLLGGNIVASSAIHKHVRAYDGDDQDRAHCADNGTAVFVLYVGLHISMIAESRCFLVAPTQIA